ncbi:MAG TPA: glycosyltransferase family 4 protein [Candidatus Limiplasma sp.]|nr:glycosyltransferase family 4 protein [Candidatus Limiplasma sp.]
MVARTVFFIQKSPALAGAQKSLLRLMQTLNENYQPVLITGSEGWLATESCLAGIPVIVHPFPSSRSLKALLIGNRQFAREVAEECRKYELSGCLVHGNDHIQSLSALAIAKALQAPSVLTLRTPVMTRRDFFKYGCHRHRHVVAVGHDLHQKVCGWRSSQPPQLIENGVAATEISSPIKLASTFPSSVVVPGTTKPRKGWRDLVDALVLLEKQGRGTDIEFVLLGNDYGQNVMGTVGAARLKIFRIRHLPLSIDFKKNVSTFTFAVHPTRAESFGMALVEMLAAGVPVLTSCTGIAPRIVTSPRFLFEPQNSVDMAEKLGSLMADFSGADQMVMHAQEIIRNQYCVTRTAAQYMNIYARLCAV